uniref:Transposase Helix-turn-helix domain-containing protein n=1 Tax=Clytia hemisphaerica TaxID=252671 RepID=A0A7M5WJ56_9CNID
MVDHLLTSDRKTKFYTGIENLQSFCNVHDICKPYIMNKWQDPKRTLLGGGYKRNFKKKVTKLWRKPKLSSEDKLLLTLMKLHLGLMEEDLAHHFGTSTTHVSNTFITRIKVLSLVLRNIVFVPNQGQLNFT